MAPGQAPAFTEEEGGWSAYKHMQPLPSPVADTTNFVRPGLSRSKSKKASGLSRDEHRPCTRLWCILGPSG
ncbi:hypothetical protein MRX96_009267 [Rhipicephalus microplus]